MPRNSKSPPMEIKAIYTSAVNSTPLHPPPPYPLPPPPSSEITIRCDSKSDPALPPQSSTSSNTAAYLPNPIKSMSLPASQPCPRQNSTHNHLGPKPRPIPPALPPLFPPNPPPKTKCHVHQFPLPEFSILKSPSNTPEPESPPKNTRNREALRVCQGSLEQCLLHPAEGSKAEKEVPITGHEVGGSSAKETQVDDRGKDPGGLHRLYLRGGEDEEDGDEREIAHMAHEGPRHGDHPISLATGSSQDQRERRSQGWVTQPNQNNRQEQSVQHRQRGPRDHTHSAQLTSPTHRGNLTHPAQVFPWAQIFPANPTNTSGGRIINFYTHQQQGQTSVSLPQWNNVHVIHQTALPVVSSPSSSAQLAGVPCLGQSPHLVPSPHLVHGPAYAPSFIEETPSNQSGSITSRPLNPRAPNFVPQHTVPEPPYRHLPAFDWREEPRGLIEAGMDFLHRRISGYDDENKKLKGDVRSLELEKEMVEEQLRGLRAHLTVVEGIKAIERAEGDRLRAQSRKVGREQERLQRKITELEVQLRTVGSERNKLEEENSKLERQLKDSSEWNEHLQRVLDAYCKVSEDWETERVNMGSKIEILQTEVDNLKLGVSRTEVGEASTPGLDEPYLALAMDGESKNSSADRIQVVEGSGNLGNSHSLRLRGGGGDDIEEELDLVQSPHDGGRSILQEPHGEGGQKEQRGHPDQGSQQFWRHPGHQTARSGQSRHFPSMLQPAQYPTMQFGSLIPHNSNAQDYPFATFAYSNYPVNQQPVQIAIPNPHPINSSGIHQRFPPIVSGLSEYDLTVGVYRGQSLQRAPIQSLEPDSSVRLPSVAFQVPSIHAYNWNSPLSTPYHQPHSSLYVSSKQQAEDLGKQGERQLNEEILDNSCEKQRLLHLIDIWRSAHERLTGSNERLKREKMGMKDYQSVLEVKQRTTSIENHCLKRENAKRKDRQRSLEKDLLGLRNDNERLQQEVGRLRHEASILRIEADELKTKLGILKDLIGKRGEVMPELSGDSPGFESHRMHMRGGGDDEDRGGGKGKDQTAHIPGLQRPSHPITMSVQGGRSRGRRTAQTDNLIFSADPTSLKVPGQVSSIQAEASNLLNLDVSSNPVIASQGLRVLQDQRDQKDMRKKRGHSAENDQAQGGQQVKKRQRRRKRQGKPPPSHPGYLGHSVGTQQPAQAPPLQSGFHSPFAPSSEPHTFAHTFIFFTDGTANYFCLNPQPLRMVVHPPFSTPSPGPHAFTFFPDGTAHYFGYNPQPLSMAFSSQSSDGIPVMYQITPPVVSSLPFTGVSSPNLVVGQYHGQFPQATSFPDFNPQLGNAYCTPYSHLKWTSSENELRQREVLERRIRDQATLEEMSERYRRLQQGVVHLKAKNDNIIPDDMELFADNATIGNQLDMLREDLVTAKRDNERLQRRRGISDFDKANVEDDLRVSRYEAKKRLDAELHPSKE